MSYLNQNLLPEEKKEKEVVRTIGHVSQKFLRGENICETKKYEKQTITTHKSRQ